MTDEDAPTGRVRSAALTRFADVERSRRDLLALAAVGGAGAVFVAGSGRAEAAPEAGPRPTRPRPGRHRLTVMGTTDTHGNVLNWDYYKDAEYTDAAGNDIGLAKIATLVRSVRRDRGEDNCLLIDAGDTIQGTPLSYYYAKIDPITGPEAPTHPMAAAMNAMEYDAAALGNHEFNYGLDTLRAFESQCDFPLLSANSVDWDTGAPVFAPYLIKRVELKGGAKLTVGILGLVTPGVAIWDKANVEGLVRFPGIVEQGRIMVPRLRLAGCDVVLVACHSGADPGSSYGDALPVPENASTQLAQEVPGIDAILVGHAHKEVIGRTVTNKATGRPVLLTEPLRWGMRLSVIDLEVQQVRGRWQVASASSQLLNANTVPEDRRIARMLEQDHDIVRTYVNSVIGTCAAAMSAHTSRFEDTAAMDFINLVQGDTVKKALAGTAQANLPVLSIAAPFNREASIPAGNVTVRDVAGMYVFDNTLLAITLTGAQVKDYLEYSAQYFKPVTGTGPFAPDDVTNAVNTGTGDPTPDYNYDVMGGLDASLSYKIDLGEPVGHRITDLTYAGDDLDTTAEFVIAINNYRQSGGGNFPGVTSAPVVYNAQAEIRQLIIDWVTAQGAAGNDVDPTTFTTYDWELTFKGQAISVLGAVEGGRT